MVAYFKYTTKPPQEKIAVGINLACTHNYYNYNFKFTLTLTVVGH